jgi:mono/diheme cytochrome c family protein
LQEPGGWLELAGTLSGIIVAALAIAAAIRKKRWRWTTMVVAAALLVWGLPRLSLITVEAFPTSFFVSPTGYSAHSIAAGRTLFAEHCVSCHGPDGRGDGPAAKDLQPPPADLTAEHIYGHSDGDLFWWVANGMGEAMPPFGAVLDETARWNLIDFIRANADARRLQTADEGTPSLRVPEFSVECPDGSDVSISQLRGRVLHLIFAGPQSDARLDQLRAMEPRAESIAVQLDGSETLPLCRTRDHEVIAAFAIYRGAEPIETEFLIDASGWLRSMWYPGVKPDWREPEVLADEIETIIKTPGQPQPVGVHVHVH